MAKKLTRRNSKRVQVASTVQSNSPKLTKRKILKQCRVLKGIIDFGPNVLYSSDELNHILSPTIQIMEHLASTGSAAFSWGSNES